MKLYVVADKDAYFDFFRDSASQATVPRPNSARFKWLTAKVSGQVKSQTRQRPDAHGAMVKFNPAVCVVASVMANDTRPDVSLRDVYIYGRRSWTMSPEVRIPRWGCCTANFHEAIWASQLPLCWPDSLEQFAVRTEGQGNYIVDV